MEQGLWVVVGLRLCIVAVHQIIILLVPPLSNEHISLMRTKPERYQGLKKCTPLMSQCLREALSVFTQSDPIPESSAPLDNSHTFHGWVELGGQSVR